MVDFLNSDGAISRDFAPKPKEGYETVPTTRWWPFELASTVAEPTSRIKVHLSLASSRCGPPRRTEMKSIWFGLALAAASLVAAPAVAQSNPDSKSWTTEEKAGQWRASKLVGLNIYNPGDEKIGEIDEIMVNSSGSIDAVIVGVGGFLGVGEHRVAIPFKELKFVNKVERPATSKSGETTGAVKAERDRAVPYPDHAVLSITKDQLKAAPEFKYANR
jgi:sporulation protein YlmC with PRC-barrel domain